MQTSHETRFRPAVVILQETFPRYRAPLFEAIVELAADRQIDVEVVHGRAPGPRGDRLSGGSFPNAVEISNRYVRLPRSGQPLVWQAALVRCLKADLVVVEQANRMLINYLLLAARGWRGPRVAFWGHGRDLQSGSDTWRARLKKSLLHAPDWWFAYTVGVAAYLVRHGVPENQITVIGNTIDIARLRSDVDAQPSSNDPSRFRCVFLGGLYDAKRLGFLFAAADAISEQVPEFELDFAGTGEMRDDVAAFVAGRPWARYVGPVAGLKHAAFLASARLILNPGLVGLVALDSFASRAPIVTTLDALHSPEIEYLADGLNARILPVGTSPEAYAAEVVELLKSGPLLDGLRVGAAQSADDHLLEAAARRFVDGIEKALS